LSPIHPFPNEAFPEKGDEKNSKKENDQEKDE